MNKRIKTVEEAITEVVEGKKNNIEISLFSRDGVRDHLKHEDIAGYQLNGDWVAVMTKDGETLVYPAKMVTFVRHYSV